MIHRFEILGDDSARPDADQIIACDGTGGCWFRPDWDLELSHWRPNRTPKQYRAGTSTEICYRFLDRPQPGAWTIAVNNHVDVDGILSVYVLLDSDHALRHRKVIIEAAEMGDFWGWGETPAQRVFQGLTRVKNSGLDATAVYTEAFRRIPAFIDGTDPDIAQIDQSLAPLRLGITRVEQRLISRTQIASQLVHYVIPRTVAGEDVERACYAPEFNEQISDKAVLWPHVRAHWDAERICLVSVERPSGWLHDLWFPGYLWADAEGRWVVPGLNYHDGMAGYELNNPSLVSAFEELQRQDATGARWALGGTRLPCGDELQGRFPLGGRCVDENGQPTASRLTPDQVVQTLDRCAKAGFVC